MSTETEPRGSGADTRRRILNVAATMFAQHGYAGTSIRDISDALGLTKAALYYHFPSKEDILAELVALPLAAMRTALETPRDLTKRAERAQFVKDVITSSTAHERDTVAVLKDPTVSRLVGQSMVQSGAVIQLAQRLAMGLSGTDNPDQVDQAHMMRAIAAVGAGFEAVVNWHLVYPDCIEHTSGDVEQVAGYVLAVLEGPDAA